MTRPKKDESLTKTKDVHLRMSETEYEILLERATASNMTVSDFIRNALDKQNVIIKYEITADVKEIKKLIGEFGKIGSNLNQIARYFNQGGIISSEMRTEIKKSLRDIYEMKYEAAHIHACLENGLLESPIMDAKRSTVCCFLVDEIMRQLSSKEALYCIDEEESCYDL